MKIITSWKTLMYYAYEEGKARKSGDPEKLRVAKARHDEYRDLCLKADEMLLHCTTADLY